MAVLGEPLFFSRDGVTLADELRYQATEGIAREVSRLPPSAFSRSDKELAASVAATLHVEPLRVDFEGAQPNVRETTIDVSRNFDYGFPREGRAPGLQVTKRIPFKGNAKHWRLQPSTFGSNPPRGKVQAQEIEIGIEVVTEHSESAVGYINRTIDQIKICLQRQDDQIKLHNNTLEKLALPYVEERRARVGNAADLLRRLGG